MSGTGQTGITGDPGDTGISGENPTGDPNATTAKYIKIDVPDFNNALAGDLSASDTATFGAGSGQGSMRSYLRLGAIEQANSSKGVWGPVAGGSSGSKPVTPGPADLAALVNLVGGNPLLWTTFSSKSVAQFNAVEGNATVAAPFTDTSSASVGESGPPATPPGGVSNAPGFTAVSGSSFTGTSFSGPVGATAAPALATVGLVVPGQFSTTMIQSGGTGTTGDPYLQELVPLSVLSTGEDLASLVKGFLDDSRMRSDAGSTAWWGGAVRIETPFSSDYQVSVGQTGAAGWAVQGLAKPDSLKIDSDLANVAPAAFMMQTWNPRSVAVPNGHPPPGAWADFGNLVAGGATGVDWTLGGFPASTDTQGPDGTQGQPFVPGWMVPIRLGGPSPSTWGAQATPNTSTVEGPLFGWDPHPSANANTPDWGGALLQAPVHVTGGLALDADGNKVAASVPLDPRDKSGLKALPGYGPIINASDLGSTIPWDSGNAKTNINAVSAWLATDYRTIETNQLYTKGGWRDHTDGNRITTTRGDKVEVIRGNYKLLVLGRQDGSSKASGFDMGGGGNDSFLTGSASTDPSTLSTITEYKLCDDGQYRSWSITKKGSGVPKLGADSVTVTLPTGSVQVAETWGWKSYTYTGVEKLKILSGGSGPPTGGTLAAPNNWFGPVKWNGSGDASDPKSYVPVASTYNNAYKDPDLGFAGGPALPIVGDDVYAKGGVNDDTRGIIWPVAETIAESHTTKTYSATFVRDTVAITAGPMLTVPFSLGAKGAGMILDWQQNAQGVGDKLPLKLPPSGGAVPTIKKETNTSGQWTGNVTAEYDHLPADLELDAFGAYPLKQGSLHNTDNTKDGGLPSDYAPSWQDTTRLALQDTGIPIPGQPYQKVNSTTAETHVKTAIARTYTDVDFKQTFTGKSYAQTGSKSHYNQLTNSISYVDTAVAETHTNSDTKFTYTVKSKSETYIGGGGWNTFDAVNDSLLGPLGAVVGGAAVPCKDDYTKIVGSTQSRAETYGTTSDYKMLIGSSSSMGLTIGSTSDIKAFVGASSAISVTAGATSTINITAAATSSIKISATMAFDLQIVGAWGTTVKMGPDHTKVFISGVEQTAEVKATKTIADLTGAITKLQAGVKTKVATDVTTLKALHTAINGLTTVV